MSATAGRAQTECSADAGRLLAAAQRLAATPNLGDIADADISTVLACLARLFTSKVELAGVAPVLGRDALTATETVTLVTAMLHAADLNIFDLAMWVRRTP